MEKQLSAESEERLILDSLKQIPGEDPELQEILSARFFTEGDHWVRMMGVQAVNIVARMKPEPRKLGLYQLRGIAECEPGDGLAVGRLRELLHLTQNLGSLLDPKRLS